MAVVDAGLLGERAGIARDLDAGVMETHGRLADAGEQVRVDQLRRHGVGAVFHPRGGVARHARGVLLGVGVAAGRQGPLAALQIAPRRFTIHPCFHGCTANAAAFVMCLHELSILVPGHQVGLRIRPDHH